MRRAPTLHRGRMRPSEPPSDATTLSDVTGVTWTDTAVSAAALTGQQGALPTLAKLEAQDYGNFGAGTHVDVRQPFLLYSSRRTHKVLATNLYWDDSKQEYVPVGERLVIPLNYPGWFWFLRDGGMHGTPWTTVEHIADNQPKVVFNRLPITCYYQKDDSPNKHGRHGNPTFSPATLPAGELIAPGEAYTERPTGLRRLSCRNGVTSRSQKKKKVMGKGARYLHCFDSRGRHLLLDYAEQGEFMPVGDMVSDVTGRVDAQDRRGVYQLTDLRNTPLPVCVKLAYGERPTTPCRFTGLLRLEEVYYEESLIACSVDGKQYIIECPVDSDIRFICACAGARRRTLQLPSVSEALEFCDDNINDYCMGITVLQNFYPGEHTVTSSPVTSPPQRPLPEYSGADERMREESYVTHAQTDTELAAHAQDTDPHYEVIPALALETLVPAPGQKGHRGQGHEEDGYMVPQTLREQAPTLPHRNSLAGDVRPPALQSDVTMTSTLPHRYTPLTPHSDVTRTGTLPHRYTVPVPPNDTPGVILPHRTIAPSTLRDDVTQHCWTLPRQHKTVEFKVKDNNNDEVHKDPRDTELRHPELRHTNLDRMESFLADSLEQLRTRSLDRRKNTSDSDVTDMKTAVEAFLEEIFDYGSMTTEAVEAMDREENKRKSFTTFLETRREPAGAEEGETESARDEEAENREEGPQHEPGQGSTPPHPSSITPHTSPRADSPLTAGVTSPRSDSPSTSSLYRLRYQPGDPRTDSGVFASPAYSDVSSPSQAILKYFKPQHADQWTPPDDVTTMSIQEVALSLLYIGMKDAVVQMFLEEKIDGKQLADLDDGLLQEGFPDLNALERKKVTDFVRGWRPKRNLTSQPLTSY